MQYVLSTGYTNIKQFYTSRALRIFIPYFSALILIVFATIGNAAAGGDWLTLEKLLGAGEQAGVLGSWLASISNLTLFFQDWIMFLRHDPGESLAISHNLWDARTPLWHYLVVPQAWSIGVELTFYAIAPFLAARFSTRALFFAVLASVSLRFVYYLLIGVADPWTYRFFPFELALFGLGMLAARLYLSKQHALSRLSVIGQRSTYQDWFVYIAFSLFLIFMLALGASTVSHARAIGKALHPLGAEAVLLFSYLPWVLVIPVLFAITKRSKLDRYIGEYSYPIYLVHYTVILIVAPLVAENLLGEWSIVVTLVLSAILVHGLVEPFDKWRKRKVAEMNQYPVQQMGPTHV